MYGNCKVINSLDKHYFLMAFNYQKKTVKISEPGPP